MVRIGRFGVSVLRGARFKSFRLWVFGLQVLLRELGVWAEFYGLGFGA